VCCVLCAVWVCCVLCAVCCVLCAVCCVLCAVCCVLCAVRVIGGLPSPFCAPTTHKSALNPISSRNIFTISLTPKPFRAETIKTRSGRGRPAWRSLGQQQRQQQRQAAAAAAQTSTGKAVLLYIHVLYRFTAVPLYCCTAVLYPHLDRTHCCTL
jgi:hypothetical protein